MILDVDFLPGHFHMKETMFCWMNNEVLSEGLSNEDRYESTKRWIELRISFMKVLTIQPLHRFSSDPFFLFLTLLLHVLYST